MQPNDVPNLMSLTDGHVIYDLQVPCLPEKFMNKCVTMQEIRPSEYFFSDDGSDVSEYGFFHSARVERPDRKAVKTKAASGSETFIFRKLSFAARKHVTYSL